jgi:hypothetical protein
MNKFVFIAAAMLLAQSGFAQTDSTIKKTDTVRVGNFIIIKKDKKESYSEPSPSSTDTSSFNISIGTSSSSGSYNKKHQSIISTNWLIFDLGFNNWDDKTNYDNIAASDNYLQQLPGVSGKPYTKDDFSLRTVKSSNVNIWLFMQKLNVYKNIISLKYGLGINMYNFRYETNVSYLRNPPRIVKDTILFSKNKLAADYITIPLMVNFNTMPDRRNGLSVSFGVSAGYLYNSRNKQVSDERGKQKIKGDIGLNNWLLAYVGELGMGPIRLYGSYSINPLHENTLKQYPYVVGIRFSNW